VKELYAEGVTKNVFCVNVDAVLAVITLKLVWKDLQAGRLTLRPHHRAASKIRRRGGRRSPPRAGRRSSRPMTCTSPRSPSPVSNTGW